MIIVTAWKNVWRNKTRSMVVIASITIGIFAGTFAVGLMNGTMEQRVDAALNEEIGHIQITKPKFRDNFDMRLLLENIDVQNQQILKQEGVEALANRLIVNGIANTASKSSALQIVGINPLQEKAVLDLDKALIAETGSYFGNTSRNNLAYIGEDLAKELGIIRYSIDEASLDSLLKRDVPETIIKKMEPFTGIRFPSQKAFIRTIRKNLSPNESKKYASQIMDAAWTFRDRAKITLTFLDANNIQTGGMFRIAGIYDVDNSMFEKSQVFVLNKDLQRLCGLDENAYNMSLIRINDRHETNTLTADLKKRFPDDEVMSWKEISPDLAMMSAMVEKFHAFFMLIILAALSFGIVNTMLMVVLERTKELGMLTAIGMNKRKVFSMIMSESVFLSLIGGVAGLFISKIIITATAVRGINFASSSEGFEAMGFSAHIYPMISNAFFIEVTIFIILTGILSSIYPALKALKLDPAEALRTE